MLHLHQSNRLEILAAMLVDRLGEASGDPFTPEMVVTQSPDMARWLTLKLADHHRIAANVEFPFPASFVWDLIQAIVPDAPEQSPFERPQMIWRLMEVLEALPEDEVFDPLRHYLQPADDDRRRFDLAQKVADIFDQYMVYRPDWIEAWENGRSAVAGDDWQAALWRRVSETVPAEIRYHRAGLLQRLLDNLDADRLRAAGFPPRLVVFAAGAMPPAHLSVFQALGEVIDVHLMLLNPSHQFWGDLLSRRQQERLSREAPEQASLHLEGGNPLLATWGQQGREFFDLLLGDEPPEADSYFINVDHGCLLHSLQQDILDLDTRHTPLSLDPKDESIRLSACHSPMREVEVLQDHLLGLLEKDPSLDPADIVVMTPDIETYAPLVDAVFGRFDRDDPRRLPYAVADRGIRAESPVLEAFFALLALPEGRMENRLVMDLLEHPMIAERRGFAEDELDTVRHWIEAAGIRWGADAEAQAEFGFSEGGLHSWRAGLDRLLLGLALPAGGTQLFEGILPYDDIEGTQAGLLGRLAETVDLLIAWKRRLQNDRTPAQWADVLGELLADFFAEDGEDADVIIQVHAALDRLREQSQAAGFEGPVSLGVVTTWLEGQLDGVPVVGRYLGQGITFCQMVPLRNLPFRVVCLLGMSDGSYPRQIRPVDFDLMARHGRQGDRSRREDDRYLFLEALLAARQHLYLSYVGISQQDNSEIPPSVLVSELLDVIDRGYEFPATDSPPSERLVRRQSLQPFAPANFDPDRARPSFAREWLAASRTREGEGTDQAPMFEEPLPPADEEWRTVALEDLLDFYGNPARHLLRRRLGIAIREGDGPLDPREPFAAEADFLARVEVQRGIMQHVEAGVDQAGSLELLRATGHLPPGRPGEKMHAEAFDAVSEAFEELAFGEQRYEPWPVDLSIGDFVITGSLTGLTPEGLQVIDVGKRHGRGLLNLWIRHLVLCATDPAGVEPASRIVFTMENTPKKRQTSFQAEPEARQHLASLLELYWEGLHRPLPLFPKSSLAQAEGGNARDSWQGSSRHRGECENPYYQAAFRGQDALADPFEAIAERVFLPLLNHAGGQS